VRFWRPNAKKEKRGDPFLNQKRKKGWDRQRGQRGGKRDIDHYDVLGRGRKAPSITRGEKKEEQKEGRTTDVTLGSLLSPRKARGKIREQGSRLPKKGSDPEGEGGGVAEGKRKKIVSRSLFLAQRGERKTTQQRKDQKGGGRKPSPVDDVLVIARGRGGREGR